MNVARKVDWKLGKLVWVSALTVLVGCTPFDPNTHATLCEIKQEPERYNQKVLSVEVQLDGDGERIVAIDPTCAEFGVAIEYSDAALQTDVAERINAAIREKLFGTSVRSISATIHGRFVTARSPGDAARIVVNRVDNLTTSENENLQ